jgi:CBS domain-containing protein
VTATPDTPTIEAIEKMRQFRIGCLPVVRNDRLVGIVTLYDLLAISTRLLEKALQELKEVTDDADNSRSGVDAQRID